MTHDLPLPPKPEPSAVTDGVPRTMSLRYWDLDWREHLPWKLDGGVTVEHARFDDVWPFIRDRYGEIFETDAGRHGFLDEPMTEAKWRFCRECDVTRFRDGERTVGVTIFHPSDWSSYYLRSAAYLPEYQGSGIGRAWMERCLAVLARHGVARVDTDVSPSNFANVRLLTRLGFNITATSNSERWGALARFTKFLQDDAEAVFLDKFCSGVRYQRRPGSPNAQERRPS